MNRIALIGFVVTAALVLGSCGGNSTLDDTEAVVYLTVTIDEYDPNIDICSYIAAGQDVQISSMTVTSNGKAPDVVLSGAQDVRVLRWVVTPVRNDGGEASSPIVIYDNGNIVPAGGATDLDNWPIYPVEGLKDLPLAYLLPENGGVDPETGNRNIRQRFMLQMFGETVSGKSVASLTQSIQFNFFCGSP